MFENKNIPESFKKVFKDMFDTSAVDVSGKKRPTFGEAISSLWNSSVFRELQKLLLSLDSLDGKMSEASIVKLDHLKALDGIEDEWKSNKNDYAKYLKK
ncbi:hypothetical protein KAZ93_00200 [Patescibacteria group bacterium]|nr:hypothetical protein [Patescibacteria group bacterium]